MITCKPCEKCGRNALYSFLGHNYCAKHAVFGSVLLYYKCCKHGCPKRAQCLNTKTSALNPEFLQIPYRCHDHAYKTDASLPLYYFGRTGTVLVPKYYVDLQCIIPSCKFDAQYIGLCKAHMCYKESKPFIAVPMLKCSVCGMHPGRYMSVSDTLHVRIKCIFCQKWLPSPGYSMITNHELQHYDAFGNPTTEEKGVYTEAHLKQLETDGVVETLNNQKASNNEPSLSTLLKRNKHHN